MNILWDYCVQRISKALTAWKKPISSHWKRRIQISDIILFIIIDTISHRVTWVYFGHISVFSRSKILILSEKLNWRSLSSWKDTGLPSPGLLVLRCCLMSQGHSGSLGFPSLSPLHFSLGSCRCLARSRSPVTFVSLLLWGIMSPSYRILRLEAVRFQTQTNAKHLQNWNTVATIIYLLIFTSFMCTLIE